MRFQSFLFSYIITAFFLVLLSGCGGGGESSGGVYKALVDPSEEYTLEYYEDIEDASLNTSYTSSVLEIDDYFISECGTDAALQSGTLILNGTDVGTTATLQNGDDLQLQIVSSTDFYTPTRSVLNVGSCTVTYTVITSVEDAVVDDFNITHVSKAYPLTTYTSDVIPISGINTQVTAQVSNGTLIKNGVDTGSTSVTVENNDTLQIKLQASINYDTDTTSLLTVGSITKTFNVRTRVGLVSPIMSAAKNTYYLSDEIPISEDATQVSTESGTIVKNGVDLNTTSTTANSGDTIQFKLLSASTISTNKASIIQVGLQSGSFSVTTRIYDYQDLTNGTYAPTEDTYYYLTMPSNGNLDIDIHFWSYISTTIFDEDMNVVATSSGSSHTVSLLAGTYIVKISGAKSHQTTTIYSPQLDRDKNFATLSNGTYNPPATTFYYLTMPTDGNLDIEVNSGQREITIYDEDMNVVAVRSDRDRVVNLHAGTYIVKISGVNTDYPTSFYSPLLDSEKNYLPLTNSTYNPLTTTFYHLTMPDAGNLDIEVNVYHRYITIYDENMNMVVQRSDRDRTVHLKAGTYIIKISGADSSITAMFYSPLFDNEKNFATLTNGTYSPSVATYYYLTMPGDGDLDIEISPYHRIDTTIYDEDMKVVATKEGSDRTVYLQAGTYIIKIAGVNSSRTATFYSLLLDNEKNFTSLTNGTYNPTETTFYYLTMPAQGVLDVVVNDWAERYTTIYDENMHVISSSKNYTHTVNLEAGTYIVKISGTNIYDTTTFYSSLLD